MLRALHVRNYVLIDSLDISFPEGLIIITGQTGAGKSILLGALSLLTGAKADASVISEEADSCVVEAEFDAPAAGIKDILDENDVEWDDSGLLVRRVVHGSGRSRSFINDCPVPVAVLASIASHLVDIHSQHQSLMLSDSAFQLSVLDLFAGNAGLLEKSGALWKQLNALKAELRESRSKLAGLQQEREFNESRYQRLADACLKDGELEELEAEQRKLANAAEIKETLSSAGELLEPSSDDCRSVSSVIKEAGRLLEKISSFVPETEGLAARLDSVRIELDDAVSELDDLNSSVEVSQDRLQEVEDRMALIYGLLQKYGCTTVQDLIAQRDALSELLFDSGNIEYRIDELEREIKDAEKAFSAVCADLRERRKNASGPLAAQIESQLHFLELDRTVFSVEVREASMSQNGADAVTFMFSSNGRSAAPVADCASGGELSRIMLCLKAVMARFKKMPTMIFDEIDTGVSGSVADKMGSMICAMGEDMQVLAITHLPQVAAKGLAHFLVSKTDEGHAVSSIKKLSPEERVFEIARMLSGATVTEEAVANARRLLA